MAGDTTERLAGLDPTALPPRHLLGLLGLLGLALLPLGIPDIWIFKMTAAFYFAVFAMSWDAVSGYTGQISFGHALFFGVGGYTSGMLNIHLGVDPLLAIPAGVVAATVAGLVVGVPALRVQGPYLSLITLVAPIILRRLFVFKSDLTGGENGLFGEDDLVAGFVPDYYLAFGLFVFALAVFLAVTRSDAGNVFTAIREDEEAVAASGINPAKFKIFAFVLSGAVGGLAGAMLVHSAVGSVSPSQLLALTISIEVIIATIFGGMGTIVGAAAGGLVLFLMRDVLGSLSELVVPLPVVHKVTPLPARLVVDMVIPGLNVPLAEIDLLLFAVITLGFLFFVPEGILPRALAAGRRLQTRVRTSPVATDGGHAAGASDREPPTGDDDPTPLEAAVARFREALRLLRGGDRR